MNLDSKTIIISGASRGIGRATALLLAQNGANVLVTARSADELKTLEAEHANIVAVPGNVTSETDMANVVQTALDRFGRIDVVINNAGYGIFKNVDEITVQEWDDLMATNVKGTFVLTKAALPTLKAQGSGHVVVVASDVAKLAGVVDGVNLKLAKCGSLREALRIIHTARAHGMMVMAGCMIETSLGITAAAHLGPLLDCVDLDGAALLRDDPFVGATITGGLVSLPTAPGLGVTRR